MLDLLAESLHLAVLVAATAGWLLLFAVAARALTAPPTTTTPTPEGPPMARRKASDYRREATHEPFDLELDTTDENGEPVVVEFADPSRLPTDTAFDLATLTDPREVLERLLGPHFDKFWAEWRFRPLNETNELVADVMEHYGADLGKPAKSRR